MYIVELINGNIITEVHGNRAKLKKGSVVKGINTIDSFSFTMLPSNPGFNAISDFQTLVRVYNTNRKKYEFHGRVLHSQSEMSSNGLITKEVTCESYFGFLCDSQQTYLDPQNWTVTGLLQHIINTHNSQLEEYKRFTLGKVTVTDPNDNLYLGIQRDNTWKTIDEKLIKKLGGEIRFRVVDGVTYLDYLTEIGATRATAIALSRNMKSIKKESDPSEYVTRLIPLGAKLNETEERLDITSANNGLNYIDDTTAIAVYGIHVGYVTFDDVTDASNLLRKGRDWLEDNNKVKVKYSINALELSLLGLDIDSFEVHDRYPIQNALLGIDDVARIIKKNIDVCEEIKSSIEVGDSFKTLSDIQAEQQNNFNNFQTTIGTTINNLQGEVSESINDTSNELHQTLAEYQTALEQTCQEIVATALASYTQTSGLGEIIQTTMQSQMSQMADEIAFNFEQSTTQTETVDGTLQTFLTEFRRYIRFSGDPDNPAITIGTGDSAITLEIDNETGIVFKKNGVAFGWWDGVNFHTGNIVVEVNERAQFGNFAFVPREDGSLSFLKVVD